jgi:serine/threonine protein kinase
VLGSPSYIAPERARGGQAGAGAPGDLWGLGASLYTAVEGHPPFERNGAVATLTAVVAEEPERAAHAGPLAPVISGLLRKDPAQRLGADEAGELLRRAAEPPPRPAPAPRARFLPAITEPWSAPPSPRASRRLLVMMAALAAVAAAVTCLAFALTG